MSTTSLDAGSIGSAQPLRQRGVPDLAHYSLQQLQRDTEFVLFRGHRREFGEASALTILVRAPVAASPAPACLRRMQEEYVLGSELDPADVVRPLSLVQADGRTMLILEDPGGESLDRLLGSAMEVGRFLRLAGGIASAVGKLHQRGIVHKDIKPANIFVNGVTGVVKLTGFGIASRLVRERQAPEPPEMIAGTLAYMAPEQTGRMNRSVDSRSDLYALGVTFYELLTGVLPFTSADPIELIHCHIAREPLPPGELASAVPAALSMIVMKLLAKTAEERYQTAAGVEADLRKCLTAWESIGRIDPFPLGLQDASERLMIPEKLYGRDGEIATLLAAFDRVVMHGGSELVLVSGYSGIGKSSVVNELHKVIVLPRGIFISGKFDLRLRGIPHSTLAQAFQGLIQQLLNGPADDITRWREAIKEAVGNQGRLLTDLIPNLVRLIGPQPTVAVLSPVDAQLRFQTVFQRFVGAFARAEHPLVIFIDDLQWLDPATLSLIEYLLSHPDTRHLLLIGAYRDNEVVGAHPLILKLDALRRAGARIDQIVLDPLSVDDINQLLCDTLRCAPDEIRPFAELLHSRSGGNPFFAGQFLTSLAEEGLIEFDPRSRSWTWDLDAILEKRLSDNPVDLVISRLRRLPPEAQEALKLLACLGSYADFATLAKLHSGSDEGMHAGLGDAVRAGAAVRGEGSYRFFHDRVQEAAYALIPAEHRAELHLQIGRLLVAQTAQERIAEKIFDLVNQLNLGAALISDWPEKVRTAELNFVAGRKAKASTAYASASSYLAAGITLLSDEGWQRSYDLTLGLFLERAECEILSSNLEQAAGLVEVLLVKARSKIDQAEVCRLRMLLQLRQGNYAPTVRTALECLRTFGVNLPDSPTPEQVRAVYEEMRQTLGERPIESLVDLPMMDDPEIRAVMKLCSSIGELAYHADGNLFQMNSCWMVKLTCRYGTSEHSTIGYGGIAVILGPVFHRFADGEAFARLAVTVAERYGFTAQKAGAHFLMQMSVLWTRPIEDALTCLEAATRSVAETGEMVYACFNRQHRLTDLLARGEPLDQMWLESVSALDFVRKYKFGQLVILSIQGFIQSLRGGAGNSAPLEETALEARVLRGGVALVACFHWILQLQRQFLLGDAERALEFAAKAKPILWSARLNLQSVDYCLYHSLAIAAVFQASSPQRRAELREDLLGHLESFRRWAESCPATFAHKHSLVAAEWARLEGREMEAMQLYEQAIRSAAKRGFLQDQALASELAARFYRGHGLERVADTYLGEARDCYARWGALAKVAQLEQSQPQVGHQARLTPKPTIEAPVEQFDLATIIKMSQAVAGEIVLEKLIETLMVIAVEHAGADRGLLILQHGGQIEAEARSGRDGVRVRLLGRPVKPSELPVLILEEVIRTQSQVILDDARRMNAFAEDEYIGRKQARSLLCLPLMKQAELIGVLYLENSLASHVFTPARIAVLKLLASQAAIALENARLYFEVAEREAKIRRLVDANIIGIVITSRKGDIIEANDAFLKMVGYDREDLAAGNLRWTDLTPPQWRAATARALEEIDSTGAVQSYEKEYTRKDGSRVPVLIGSAAFDEQRDQGVAYVLDLSDRKRAERALQRSEAYLAEAQRLTHTGSWAFNDATGQYTYFSDGQFRIYGLEPAPGHPPERSVIISRFHPEDRERVLGLVEQMVREKRAYTVDYRIVLPNGAVKHLHSTGHPVMDERGELLEQFGTVADVTERWRAETRLHMETRVTRVLSEASSLNEAMPKVLQAICESQGWHLSALWQLDRQDNVLRCTGLWCAASVSAAEFEAATRASVFHCSGTGLPGRVWARGQTVYIDDVTRDRNFPRAKAAAQAGFRGAIGFPILLGGEVLGVIESFTRDLWQPDSDLVASLSTIGGQIGQFLKRTAADEELQLRVNMLQQIPAAAWSAMPDGTPDIVNQLWYELTGQTPGYVRSHPEAWMTALHPEDRERAAQIYWEGIRSGRGFTLETRYLRASDGTYRWHLDRAVAVRDAGGRILRFVGTSTDVHDLRQVQDELRNTQAEFARITRVMTMGELTASVAHEVNQPLGAMVTSAASCARWLAAKPPQMDKARQALERIANDGKRAGAIIQRIRTLMKRQTPRRDWLDVNEMILEVIALTHYQLRRNDIVLETRLVKGVPQVWGDKVQCQQVLLNLIVNAVEAMSEIEQRRRELTIVSAADGPDAVQVEVRDTGAGLDADRATQLFEPFYTTKAEGLGIGLSISRSIVEAHGGRLTAAANAPHGAVFCVWLPVKEQMP